MSFGLTSNTTGAGLYISGTNAASALTSCSVVGWWRRNVGTITGASRLIGKETGNFTSGWHMALNGTTGVVRFNHARATQFMGYATTETIFADQNWHYVAAVYFDGASNNNRVRFYSGDLVTQVTQSTAGTIQDGSGNFTMDSAADPFVVFNNGPGAGNTPGGFDCAWVQVYNSVLSYSDILSLQFNPRVLNDTCVLYLNGLPTTEYSAVGSPAYSASRVSVMAAAPLLQVPF